MNKLFQTLFGVLIILGIWQVLAWIINNDLIIPTPGITFPFIVNYLSTPDTLLALWHTTWKVFLALSLSILFGLPVGFALGAFTTFYHVIRPLLMAIQAAPIISWLTLVIFAWGIGWKGPIFISTLTLLPASILITASGVRNLDIQLLEMAHLYRAPSRRIIKEIYLGSLLPFMFAILNVNIGQAWKVILVTEYLCGNNGLGEKILLARMNINTPGAWALTLIAVVSGIITEYLAKQALKKVSNYGYLPDGIKSIKSLW
jgi:NitT/TauT family transport system permease protein